MAKSRKNCHDNTLDTGGPRFARPPVSSQGSWQFLRDFAMWDNWAGQKIYTTAVLDNSANRLARRPRARTTDARLEAGPRCFTDEWGVLLSDLR